MFKFLRSKAKIFYWVIAAAFILFIFLAWGMDVTGRRGGRTSRDTGLVGSVDGLPITAYEYDRAYQDYLARMRQQNPDRELTANQRAGAAQQVWDAMVRDRIAEAEVRRLDLKATDDEILDILYNDPPPELLAQFKDEQGNPDLAAYRAALSDPNRDWSGVEAYLRRQLPRQKLEQMIIAGATVTEPEVREAYLNQTTRVVAEYIGLKFADIPLEEEPTEEEIQTFYQGHAGLYHRDERVRLAAVAWPKVASESDKAEVRQLALEVKQEIDSGQRDFAEAAAIYSQDGTSENGGDLGTFGRDRMVAPFTVVAFSLPVGQISDPVETEFGYHLIEVLERFEENGEVTKVHARHILLRIEPGETTLADLYTQVEDFRERAAAKGLAAAAAVDSLQLLEPVALTAGRDIPGLRGSVEGVQFAFRAKPGEMSPILENEDNFYLVSLIEKIPPGPAPLDEVRAQVIQKVDEEKKLTLAAARLSPAVGAIQMGQSFAAAAAEYGLAHAVTDTIGISANVPDVGYGTAFNAVALEIEPGRLVPEVQTRLGLYALRTLWKSPFDEAIYEAQREQIRNMLLSLKQRELAEAWYQGQLARADIVDQRDTRRTGGA
jgi:peptidyl-prolyl cis-trans isomerase D